MSLDVGKATEGLENELRRRLNVTERLENEQEKRKNGLRMNCDVGEATEGLENEQSLHLRHYSFSNPSVALPTSQLILQLFRCFTYVTVHSQTLLSLLLRHKLFT